MDFTEIKSLIEDQGTALVSFKQDIFSRLDVEAKAREELEKRLGRPGLGIMGDKNAAAEYKAMNDFVRNGADDWSKQSELKSMSIGSDPDGGYLVLPVMSNTMTTRLFNISPMRGLCRTETVNVGDAFEEPDDRDEVGASWVGESSSRPDTTTPKLGMIRVPLHEIFAQPKATQRLLDDTNRDLGAWLEGKLTDKFGRTEGSAFVTGDGVAKPRGFLDYPTVIDADFTRAIGKLQYVASGNASTLGTDPATLLRTLMWTLRTPYRSGATWTMNSATASSIDSIKDATGQFLWRAGMTAGAPDSLLGYPVAIDEDMPDIAANACPIAFGNFQKGYIIVDRPGIKLLRDPYTDKPNVRFYGYKRVGGGLANDDAIKLIKISAS